MPGRRLLFVGILVFLVCIVWWHSSPDKVRFPEPANLQSGDIVLIRGISFRSGIVRLLEGVGSGYSHVGLVVVENGHPFVIHADPSGRAAYDRVIKEPWHALITPARIGGATVFRLAAGYPANAPEVAALAALQFAVEARPFDHDFDLLTPRKLYCTELVWRAYKDAGIDLSGPSFGNDRQYLFPSDLIESGFLCDVEFLPPRRATMAALCR